MGEDEHGALAWLGAEGAAPARQGALWSLADDDVPGRPSLRDRIDAPCVLDQPINAQSFIAYVEQYLLPTLSPGDVVIMDNLSSHKRPAVRAAIRSVGARLLFLPPYSPDLNPIEQMFAKLKHLLRKAAERTAEATWKRIGSLLEAFLPHECAAYLANSGYAAS